MTHTGDITVRVMPPKQGQVASSDTNFGTSSRVAAAFAAWDKCNGGGAPDIDVLTAGSEAADVEVRFLEKRTDPGLDFKCGAAGIASDGTEGFIEIYDKMKDGTPCNSNWTVKDAADVSRVPWKSRGVASVGLVYLV
jgi:hypothetical protein